MGLCVTKPNTKQPKSLIRLIKVENEGTIPKPLSLIDLQAKILQLWFRFEKHLNQLIECQRTYKLLHLKKQINLLLTQNRNVLPIEEKTMSTILENMEQIALLIEELIREELLIQETSTRFHTFNTQILELLLDYANLKNCSQSDKTQLCSFV